MTPTAVYNVFHHDSVLEVACHLQSDASPCWAPEIISDASGANFATSGQPGLWLDQATGRLYVFATRASDQTGGVVCIDTSQAASNPDPFCGFTPLTATGDAPLQSGISGISDPVVVGSKWYAFNYVSGAGVTGTQNKLLCFDLTTFSACGSQPFSVGIGTGNVSDTVYPPPAVAGMGNQVIVPVIVGSSDELACFNGSTEADCSGSWPVPLSFSYDSNYGAPFPMMNGSGTLTGLCLPSPGDPCYTLSGAPTATPAGMTNAIPATSGWNGTAFVLGPRVYVPNGNSDEVDCYDYNSSASCANFPKPFSNLGLLYTVNTDPQRPTCIWVNSDNGPGQIQNFDAYTGGACGQGPIRVLASSMVVPTQLCTPYSYTSLQVTSPAPSTYSSGSVAFEDGDGTPIPGASDRSLDNTGSVSLTGLNLSSNTGLPQFLITLVGEQGNPSSVVVQLTWTGTDDPSCIKPGTVVTHSSSNRYVALGDSVPYGHGLANPYPNSQIGLPASAVSQGPSDLAYPGLVASALHLNMSIRSQDCSLTKDDLTISGANAAQANVLPGNNQCTAWSDSESVQKDELPAAQLAQSPAKLVTIQAGADDISFGGCLQWELTKIHGLPIHASGTKCVQNGSVTWQVASELTNVRAALTREIEQAAPYAERIVVLNYYQPIPNPADFKKSSIFSGQKVDPVCWGLSQNLQGAYNDAIVLQSALNVAIDGAVSDAHRAGVSNVQLVDLTDLETHHEMCTGNPALFSGELMLKSEFYHDLQVLGECYLHRIKSCATTVPSAEQELKNHSWRTAHPNKFGQQDIAHAIEAHLGNL